LGPRTGSEREVWLEIPTANDSELCSERTWARCLSEMRMAHVMAKAMDSCEWEIAMAWPKVCGK